MDKDINNIPGIINSKICNNIKNFCGLEILRDFRKLISQAKSIAKHRGHLFYNHSYIRVDILPTSLQFKSPINTAAGKKLARKFGFNFLKLRINESHHWIRTYRKRNEAILLSHFIYNFNHNDTIYSR